MCKLANRRSRSFNLSLIDLQLYHKCSFICYISGFLQFIESTTVAEVLESEGSIHNFFRKHHPNETGPYGITNEVIDTYVRSCGKSLLM